MADANAMLERLVEAADRAAAASRELADTINRLSASAPLPALLNFKTGTLTLAVATDHRRA